jgi:hypothetical protein
LKAFVKCLYPFSYPVCCLNKGKNKEGGFVNARSPKAGVTIASFVIEKNEIEHIFETLPFLLKYP